MHTQTQTFIAQQNQFQQEIFARLNSIQTALANGHSSNKIGVEPLDHLLEALKRLADSGEARGSKAIQLSSDGRYADAAIEAIRLAEEEASAATYLGNAAKAASDRAAARWLDAGDIAFISDHIQAANAYERCTELDPSNPYGWSRLGEVSWWIGDLKKALHAFNRMWHSMPEGVATLAKAVDPSAVQLTRYISDHPNVSREEYIWAIRGIVIAGLNIIEILRYKPSLVSKLGIRLVPADRLDEQRKLTEADAAEIIEFFSERVHNLGGVVSVDAVPTEHRRILTGLAHVASYHGELEKSEEYLQRARVMLTEQRDFVTEAIYLCNLGVIASLRGLTNTARSYFTQVIELCKGDPRQGQLFVSTKLTSVQEAALRHEQHKQKLANGTAVASPAADEIEVCNLLADEFERDTEAAMRRAQF